MDRDEEVRRGQRAEQLLKDPMWTGAWEDIRFALFSAIENAKTDEGALAGKKLLNLSNDLRRIFEGHIRTGQVANHEIRLDEERKKRWPWAA